MPDVIGHWKGWILNPSPKANERWRVALAGFVAALAIPFLVIDTPATAEGIETVDAEAIVESNAPETTVAPEPVTIPAAVEVVVIDQPVSPDISLLAQRASTWGAARTQAVADGLVELRPPALSNTDLSLLPTVPAVPTPDTDDKATLEDAAPDEDETPPSSDGDTDDAPIEADPDEVSPPAEADEAEEPVDAVGEVINIVDAGDEVSAIPSAPPRVDGRVPPPAGGPTAAQWDALRRCESTHNYEAINHTGTYRGAYQFSQTTWDWVAGIHWPHLVGVDPATAQPAWQDIMAYTLYAMRGWDQWPICGQNLL